MLVQSFVFVPLAGITALLVARAGLDAMERRFVSYAFLAHVVASFGLVVYHAYVFRGGDMYLYTEYGRRVAELMRYDPARYVPEAANLTLQRETVFPFSILLEGTPTASLMGLTAFGMVAFGDSMYAVCLAFSFFAFVGTVDLYKAVRFKLTPAERRAALTGILLVPSVVFWSSGIVKEAVVLGALGFVLRGISDALVRRRFLAVVSAVMGAGLIAMIKPYVLGPLILALGAWFYAGRGHKLAFGYKVLGVTVALGGLVAFAKLFPEYGADLAGTIANTQRNFAQSNEGAGSGIEIGDLAVDGDAEERTLAGSLKWAPLGLFNALLRPALFDVRNVTTGIAALEMTALVWMIAVLIHRHDLRRVARELASHPPFLFAVVFVLAMGTSVGLATANLGSLSRYRVPMMPMYVASVLALRARLGARAARRAAPTGANAIGSLKPAMTRSLTSGASPSDGRRTTSSRRSQNGTPPGPR